MAPRVEEENGSHGEGHSGDDVGDGDGVGEDEHVMRVAEYSIIHMPALE